MENTQSIHHAIVLFFCCTLLYVIVLCFVVRYFMSILVHCNHFDGEERAGCFA